MPIVLKSNVTDGAPADAGIWIDGSINNSAAIFLLGTDDSTDTTTATAPDGVFQFNTGNANGIKVSMEVAFSTSGTGNNRSLSMFLSNSTVTANATPFGNANTGGRLFYVQNTPGTSSPTTGNGTWTPATNTIESRIFKNTDAGYTAGSMASHGDKAFIGLIQLGNGGAKFLLKSIKIEYVE
jgi:hypothetical protein